MSIYDNLPTACDTCKHRDVCKYTETYYKAVDAMKNAAIRVKNEAGNITAKKICDIDFLKFLNPACEFYLSTIGDVKED